MYVDSWRIKLKIYRASIQLKKTPTKTFKSPITQMKETRQRFSHMFNNFYNLTSYHANFYSFTQVANSNQIFLNYQNQILFVLFISKYARRMTTVSSYYFYVKRIKQQDNKNGVDLLQRHQVSIEQIYIYITFGMFEITISLFFFYYQLFKNLRFLVIPFLIQIKYLLLYILWC